MDASLDDGRWDRMRALLARGPVSASEAARSLGVSQPTFSRLVRAWGDRLIVDGRGRNTTYLGSREILDSGKSLPLVEVQPDGSTRQLGTLAGAFPNAFFFEARAAGLPRGYFEDLPYFLQEMRPTGFLGRLVPRQHPELGFAADIAQWTADNVIAYASQLGWDLPGNLIVGTPAFQLFLRHCQTPGSFVSDHERDRAYPARAEDVLAAGQAGSSAGGEQPKFLVPRSADGRAAIVKFSPPAPGAVAERVADLLVAEHLALEIMREYGQEAARSEVFRSDGRMFLESARFDRLENHGRRGVVSLFSLDAEFIGHLGAWTHATAALIAAKVLPAEVATPVRWRERFGHLIGNTDMHGGNLAFFTNALRPETLTPAYDMTPARYAPRGAELVAMPPLNPPLPEPEDAPIWASVCEAAAAFWNTVAGHPFISETFRAIARDNLKVVRTQRALAQRLPSA